MITKLACTNFMPFGEMELNLPPNGITQITGRVLDEADFGNNGAGKSSILDLVRWTLYGEFNRGPIDGVINSQAKKNCWGHATIQLRAGSTLVIDRYRKHKENGTKVEAKLNGESIEGATAKETQSLIDAHLGLDVDSFNRLCVFDRSMSLATIGDDDAKKLLERLIGRIDFSAMAAVASAKLQHLAGEVKTLEGRHLGLVHMDQTNAQALEAARVRLREARRESDHKRADVTAKIGENAAQGQALQSEMDKHQASVDSLSSAMSEAHRNGQRRAAQSTLRERLSFEYQNLSAQAVRLGQKQCPTCGGKMDPPAGEIERVNDSLRKVLEQIKAIDAEKVPEDDPNIISRFNDAVRNVNQLREQLRRVQADRSRLEAMLAEIGNQTVRDEAEVSSLERRHVELTHQLAEMDQALWHTKHEREVAEHVDKAFSRRGIRTYLLNVLIPSLSTRLNQYLNYLTHGSIFALVSAYKGKQERFNIEVDRRHGGATYGSLSVGERGRVDVALILTILDYLREQLPVPIVMFDELFDSLDPVGAERVIGLLREVSKDTQIVIISHSPSITSLVDRSVTVVKDGGISHLE